ncbi:AAA family ATPase [Sedimenticola hydrogenitrophicus]|uniref:AAA family ATPase n=1 Tax=Sedimenticola hydrogenitrophicus TaxID=2967975 RepID=UPI0021A27B5F|nr:AAA family ATPase [Sedimenticola hydrogenitrophicus]
MSMDQRPADAVASAESTHRHDRTPTPGRSEAFFSTPELRQRLDLLRHLTDNSEKILLIKGATGSGKSTLLQQFRDLSREDWALCCLTADHMLQPDQFFSLLYRRFGLTGPAAMNIEELLKRFEMLHAAGRLPVIVVDDAQLLPVATLIALFRLFERRPGSRALIRVVLFATPEINAQFQTPQLQAMNLQSVQSLEMPLFDAAQAQAFIGFLLDTEGKPAGLKLAPGRIERIIRDAAGVPGVLEERLQGVFAGASKPAEAVVAQSTAKQRFGIRAVVSDLPLSVLMGAPLLLVLLLLTLVFQDEINRLFDQTEADPAVEGVTSFTDGRLHPLQLPQPGSGTARETEGPGIGERLEQAPPLGTAPRTDQPPQLLAGPEPEAETATEPEPEPEPETATETEQAPGPAVIPPTAAEAMASQPGVTDEPATPKPGTAPAAGEVASAVNDVSPAGEASPPDNLPAGEDAPGAGGTPVVEEDAAAESPGLAARPAAATDGADSATPTAGKRLRDERWILTRSPVAYTLQLVGVRDEPAARRFIEQHRLRGDVAYFKTTRSGQPWYSVIHGVYGDRSSALKGRETLPPALRNSGVWPRTFASVQAAMGK